MHVILALTVKLLSRMMMVAFYMIVNKRNEIISHMPEATRIALRYKEVVTPPCTMTKVVSIMIATSQILMLRMVREQSLGMYQWIKQETIISRLMCGEKNKDQ